MSKHSHWGPSMDYPIYMNPTHNEIVELAQSGWDTVRICVENDLIALASGHGNTHSSIISMVRQVHSRRFLPETYILYRQGADFLFNLEDVGGSRRARARKVIRAYFSDAHGQVLTDLIEETLRHQTQCHVRRI